VVLTDNIANHPKIVRAGEMLGPDGRARALALYVASIGYAHHYLTDGFVPDGFLHSCGVVRAVSEIAKVFADRRVRLFHRRTGGYVIHDYHAINPKARTIKENQAKERARLVAYRARKKANGHA
jgi:hypothetical protein